jgi:hypothetical protein
MFRSVSKPASIGTDCKLDGRRALPAETRLPAATKLELGMFVERRADVSAHYAISEEPQSLEDWTLEFTGKPLPK